MKKLQFFTFLLSTLLIISCSDPKKKTDKSTKEDTEPVETLDTAIEKGLIWHNTGSSKVLTPLKAAVDFEKLSDTDKEGAAGKKLAEQSKLLVASADRDEIGVIDFVNYHKADMGKYKLYTSFSFVDNVLSLPEAITTENLANSLSTVKLIRAGVAFVPLNPDGSSQGTTVEDEAFFETEMSATEKFNYLFPAYNFAQIAYIKKTPETAISSIGSKTLTYKGNALISLANPPTAQTREVIANKKIQNIDLTVNMNSGSPSITSPLLDLGSEFEPNNNTGIKSVEFKAVTAGNNLDQIIITNKTGAPVEYSSQKTKIIFGGPEAEEIGVASTVNLTGKILAMSLVGIKQAEEETEETGN